LSRKRYISTDLSTDIRLAELAEHGTLPLLLYTWAIPHFDDWGRISGDPRQFKLTVCPALEYSSSEVLAAIDQIANVGLWNRYQADGKWVLAIPSKSWFKHQSYISKEKRNNDEGSNFKSMDFAEEGHEKDESPKNAEEQREAPQNPSSFSFSSSVSLSVSDSKDTTTITTADNPFRIYENERFGFLTSMLGQKIGEMIDTFTERWVCEAMKEAVYYEVKTLPYVNKILIEWQKTGHAEPWTLPKKEKPSQRNPRSQQRTGGYSNKPAIAIVQTDSTKSNASTPEELEAMRQRALRMDEKFNKQVPS
jgi:DnaD/phage-associated family protein